MTIEIESQGHGWRSKVSVVGWCDTILDWGQFF